MAFGYSQARSATLRSYAEPRALSLESYNPKPLDKSKLAIFREHPNFAIAALIVNRNPCRPLMNKFQGD